MSIAQNQVNEKSPRKLPLLWVSGLLTLALSMFSFASSATAQDGSFEELQRDTRELMDSVGAYTAQQRDKAVAEVKQSLAALDRSIDSMQARFEANMEVMSIEAQQMNRAALEELREQRAAVNGQLEQLADNSAQAWDRVKAGFFEAYEKMYEAWENAERSLTDSSS